MKYALLCLCTVVILSCSKNNDSDCADIEAQYLKSLGNTGGSQAAIARLTEQYNDRKREAGCN